jgi:hypothetical protein
MLLLGATVCWGLWRDLRWHRLLQPQVVEMFALTMTFLAIYFILPNEYSEASNVAVRALALVSLFVVLGRAHLAEDSPSRPAFAGTLALPLAVLLVTLNLIYIAMHLVRQDAFAAGYRQIVQQIPRGATVLPVYTGGKEGKLAPRLHIGSWAVTERDALTPYLFTGDGGHPMKYFRYKQRPYAPPEMWYASKRPVMVAWRPVACSYQFILIGKPYDVRVISLRTSVRAENESAALLSISQEPYECGR